MSIITRAEFTHVLNDFWGRYIEQFHRLSPPDQQAFLQQQGYGDLTGLLAHVIAWWQDGSDVVEQMCVDPGVQNPDYDVDAFNAGAVQHFAQTSEMEMARLYEQQRQAMLDIIQVLTDKEIADERINTRLYYEIIQHMNEHALPMIG